MPYFAESVTICCMTCRYVSLYFPRVGSNPGHMNPRRTTLRPSDFKSFMSCSENVPSEKPSISGCHGNSFTTTFVPWKKTSRPKLSTNLCLSGFTEIGRRSAETKEAKAPSKSSEESMAIKLQLPHLSSENDRKVNWEISHENKVSIYKDCIYVVT